MRAKAITSGCVWACACVNIRTCVFLSVCVCVRTKGVRVKGSFKPEAEDYGWQEVAVEMSMIEVSLIITKERDTLFSFNFTGHVTQSAVYKNNEKYF